MNAQEGGRDCRNKYVSRTFHEIIVEITVTVESAGLSAALVQFDAQFRGLPRPKNTLPSLAYTQRSIKYYSAGKTEVTFN